MTAIDIIIVAAGSGLRFGAPLPKQFCLLDGRPVLMHTIDVFRKNMPEANIITVISHDMAGLWLELCRQYDFESPVIVFGGNSRWQSIYNALDALYHDTPDRRIVMVHDGVRPLVDSATIGRLVEALADNPDIHGVIPAIKVTDSIRHIDSNGSSSALDRDTLRAVQTPQAFRADLLLKAYMRPYQHSFTDDASVMESAGYSRLILSEGSPTNIKITNPGDIEVAQMILRNRQGK